MQLSELYRNQTETKKFYIEGSSSGAYVAFNQSRRYIDMYSGITEFDKSCVYTMCTDDSMNIVSKYNRYTCNVNHITVDFEQFKHDNSVIFNYWNNTDNISDFALTNNKSMTGWLTLLTNVNVQNYLLYPKVWVIEKDNLTFAGDNYTCLSQSDVVLVSLKQLYENKDKYVVVDFNCKSYYQLSNRYYMGVALPYRCFFNNSYITGGVIGCSNGSGFLTTKTQGNTTTYGQRGTGGVATSWIKGLNFDDATSNYVFSCIYPLDIDNKKDDTYEFIDEENGGWIVKHGATSFACKNYWTVDYVLKLFASLGVYVVWDDTLPTGETLKNSLHTAIGEMDTDGFTTGRIILPNEKAASTSPNLNYGEYTDSIADPDKYRPAPSGGDDIDNIQLNALSGYSTSFTRYYIMTAAQVNVLASWMNSPSRPDGYDALDNIISLYAFPYDITDICTWTDVTEIQIGTEKFSATGNVAQRIETRRKMIDAGSITVPARYGNYLDYEPYTTASVYIPYCGVVDISLNYCAGKEIKVTIIADVITGACRGVVSCGSVILATKAGQIGDEIVLTSDGVGRRHAALLSGLLATAGGIVGTAAAATSGNVTGAAAGGLAVLSGITKLEQAKNASYSSHIGNTSADADYNLPSSCYLFMTQPVSEIPESYAHSEGYPCLRSEVFSNCKGYTVVSNADLSGIAATAEELSEIKRYLEAGVIVQYE